MRLRSRSLCGPIYSNKQFPKQSVAYELIIAVWLVCDSFIYIVHKFNESMFYMGVKVKVIYHISEYESQGQIISIYSKIKENYFYILEIEENGWIRYTI